MKKRNKETHNLETVFYDETEDESYKRYKQIQYRNLILKSLLSFLLGLILAAFIKTWR